MTETDGTARSWEESAPLIVLYLNIFEYNRRRINRRITPVSLFIRRKGTVIIDVRIQDSNPTFDYEI